MLCDKQPITDSLVVATPGVVINVFLAIVIGSFALALAGPELQGIPL